VKPERSAAAAWLASTIDQAVCRERFLGLFSAGLRRWRWLAARAAEGVLTIADPAALLHGVRHRVSIPFRCRGDINGGRTRVDSDGCGNARPQTRQAGSPARLMPIPAGGPVTRSPSTFPVLRAIAELMARRAPGNGRSAECREAAVRVRPRESPGRQPRQQWAGPAAWSCTLGFSNCPGLRTWRLTSKLIERDALAALTVVADSGALAQWRLAHLESPAPS